MNPNLREHERELVKLVNFFRKRAEKLLKEGKLSEEHSQMNDSCVNLVSKLELHANVRAGVLEQRDTLQHIVKDNAQCPDCNKNTHLKFIGVAIHEKGWKSNKYRCRKCNIEFIWNRPNNPWDLVTYIEDSIVELEKSKAGKDESGQAQVDSMIAQMHDSLAQLRPALEKSDSEYQEMESRDLDMKKIITEFKKFLLIEKVKMDAWEESQMLQ